MLSKHSWSLVIVLSLLLCACGGGESDEAEPAATDAPTVIEPLDYEKMPVEALRARIAEQPEDFDALHALGIALHQAGKVEEALPHFEKCAALRPAERQWVELGAIYFLLKRTDEAEALFHKALEESPRSGPALFHLGNVAHSKGELDQAISLYSQAVEAEDNYLIANYRLAEVYRESGKATEAYRSYEAVLDCEPSGPGDLFLFDRSMLQMAALDIQHGAAERATELLKLLIAENPQHGQAHFLMAQAWKALGRDEDAAREMALHSGIVAAAGTGAGAGAGATQPTR